MKSRLSVILASLFLLVWGDVRWCWVSERRRFRFCPPGILALRVLQGLVLAWFLYSLYPLLVFGGWSVFSGRDWEIFLSVFSLSGMLAVVLGGLFVLEGRFSRGVWRSPEI